MNLSGGTQGNGGDLSDVPLTPPGGSNPITAGNRSGDGATMSNSIDSVINQSGSTQIGNNRAPGILAVRGTLDQTNVQAMLRGLDQKKGVDMLAKPSIVTRSGQASSTVVSREFIYPTEYDPPQLPNSTGISTGGAMPVTPSTPTAFKTREVGIILDVLPVVDANKQFVTVNLNPSFTDFDGYVNYGTPITSIENGLLGPEQVVLTPNSILMPVFSSQRLSTPSVDVADGATVVVGGLLDDRVQNVEDETPGLSKLPVVGRLFQSKVKKSASTAIIFLVNVELMDPTGRRIHNP
jgi:general secretion pathway protein D